jgi:hypothetical protein
VCAVLTVRVRVGRAATKRASRRGGERLEVALDQLIQRYVRAFAASDPVQAFHYYAALTLARTDAATVQSSHTHGPWVCGCSRAFS